MTGWLNHTQHTQVLQCVRDYTWKPAKMTSYSWRPAKIANCHWQPAKTASYHWQICKDYQLSLTARNSASCNYHLLSLTACKDYQWHSLASNNVYNADTTWQHKDRLGLHRFTVYFFPSSPCLLITWPRPATSTSVCSHSQCSHNSTSFIFTLPAVCCVLCEISRVFVREHPGVVSQWKLFHLPRFQ